MSAALTFLGAAGTVTGAKFLVETPRATLLLDCGLFQGLRDLRQRNWAPCPLRAPALASVVVSHAHLDHSGYLPRLVHEGFAGPIFASPGTGDLLGIMLPDAAALQEEEAEYRNRKGATRYRPALPLFTSEDAAAALKLVRRVPFETSFGAAPGVDTRFHRSGHILGASSVELVTGGRRIVYSGDLGRYGVPVMRDPEPIADADVLLVESTYGDRRHPDEDGSTTIRAAVERVVASGGVLLIPAFAVGRTQDVLYLLRELETSRRIPAIPVVLDSPMAASATVIYARHPEEHDADARRVAARGERPFVPARFSLSRTVDDSKRLNDLTGPAIIIAGSGMATGGRILHHLRQRLSDRRTVVLFVGYQAPGTRGRLLHDGAETLRIFGEDVPVRATIMTTDALSAHADRDDILRWLGQFRRPPGTMYIVHGEPDAAEALRAAIVERLGWQVRVAADGERIEL